MFAICNNLGLLGDQFFPTTVGRDYALSPYLHSLTAHRNDFTVFNGVSHPNVDGGHPADICFLTAAPHPGSSSFRNTISLDQQIAEHISILTRFPSITLAVNTRQRSLSWTGTGVAIPPEDKAAEVFKQLFIQGTAAQVDAQIRRLDTGRSILDTVADQAKELQCDVNAHDRDRLDQYFTSVRDLEQRLKVSREWEKKPKPVVRAPAPIDPANPAQYMETVKVTYDLVRLAFETDSSRAITLMPDSVSTPSISPTTRRSKTAITTSRTTVKNAIRAMAIRRDAIIGCKGSQGAGIDQTPPRTRQPRSGLGRGERCGANGCWV
jgi:hypothetical protein